MKHISMAIMGIMSLVVYSCTGHNSAQIAGGTNIIAANSKEVVNTKTDAANASFSCKIDGKDFSGQGTDQMGNAAFVTSPGIINFVLVPIVAGQKGIPAQLSFHVADKGTTTIHGTDNPSYSVRYTGSNTSDNDYGCKEMTVNVNSSGARVTGTFSGTLIEPKTERDVPVNDGNLKFHTRRILKNNQDYF